MTLVRRISGLSEAEKITLLRGLTDAERDAWLADWPQWAHAGQLWPAGDWRSWVMMAGRGFGKTRAGAEWVAALVRACGRANGEADGLDARIGGPVRIALVAATTEEARRVMVEGPSGLLSLGWHASQRPRFEPSRRRLAWPCGSEATLFSGANPEALRGPEHHFAWCDELAKWRHPQETWDMLQLGLRAGARPRALVTTTPRAGCGALGAILEAADTIRTGGPSAGNPHLPAAWLAAVQASYGGTALGRQEIDGLFAQDLAGTLWPAALIEASRGVMPPAGALVRVVVAVDPPASAQGGCGIIACGLDRDGIGHVLADHSAAGLSPDGWAQRVRAAVDAHGADRLAAEANQGGEMVRSVLHSAGVTMPVTLVHASRGKSARAEPVAALFESRRARLAGRFPALEAELAGLIAGGGYEGPGGSPDRADAMVWAFTLLMLSSPGEARVRTL